MARLYRYSGDGSRRFNALGQRDYTEDQFAALDLSDQRIVKQSGDWTAMDTDDELKALKLDELKAMAVDAGADAEAVEAMRTKADVIAAIEGASTPGADPQAEE